ncbi:hypothetical protein Taro_022557 [Colocasia esculenta]|uniref:Uncharacterized protein n=1 Tax=Colocasia esculenta TaxID=4460 RepID=A0A843UUR8_COLES|nr:hypothetical protein [Colocasia esculenta]
MTPAPIFKSSGVIKRHTSRPIFKSSGVIKRHTSRPCLSPPAMLSDGGTNTPTGLYASKPPKDARSQARAQRVTVRELK